VTTVPRKRDIAILCGLAIPMAGLDGLLTLLSPPTTGWAGPHATLTGQLLVDLTLPLLLWFPRTSATLALLVTTAFTVSPPGLLVPDATVTLLTMPLAVPVIIGRLAGLRDRRSVALIAGFIVVGSRLWAPDWSITPAALLATVVPALATLYVDARRRLLCSLRERAERAERERDLLAERAVFRERHRLAAEMHDVVTHRLSLVVLHAGALGMVAGDDTVRRAAEDIRSAGVLALDELRDLLGVLRGTQSEHAETPAAETRLDPAVLAAESESVGVPVDLRVDGTPGQVSPAVARTAYRVVQEALTNIRKHAPGAAVTVRVAYQPSGVRVRVANTASGLRPDAALAGSGAGAGLTGLRHRVEVIGGSLTAGPRDGGGWAVTAILPMLASAARESGS